VAQGQAGKPGGAAGWASFWSAQAVGWGLFAVVDLVNRQLTYRDFAAAVVLTLVAYPLLIALSGALRLVYERECPRGGLDRRTVGVVAVASPLAALLAIAVMAGLREMTGWRIQQWRPLEELVLPLAYYGLAFVAWSISYFWIRAERERVRARESELAAQMEALKAQIRELQVQLDPHFLFNALNGLAEEVPEHPEAALAMIRDLTAYLRHVLAGVRQPVVPMAAEAEALAAYLRIQEARFGSRVSTRLHLDPAAAGRPVANLLLQPLVENAFEHGDRRSRLVIDIRLAAAGAALEIEIANTGRLSAATPGHHGLGLANLRRRLDLHYPGRHTFALRQEAGGGGDERVVAVLRLEGEPCSAS